MFSIRRDKSSLSWVRCAVRCRVQWRNDPVSLKTCLAGLLTIAAHFAFGQVNATDTAATNRPPALIISENATPASAATNQLSDTRALIQKIERVRSTAINGRRHICGLVLQVRPDGLVVDSGYADLLRPELARSWVVSANVSVSHTPNLVEEKSPGSICVGLVFVTAIPKRPIVKPYDYVILEAYPAGQYTYAPVPNVNKNLRRFSVELETAIQLNLGTGEM